MDNSLKGLMLAAGTIITCIIIGLGFSIAREAQDTAAAGAEKINRLNVKFLEDDKLIYDGAEVSGSEVLNVIKKYQGEALSVKVKTKGGTAFYGYSLDITTGDLIEGSVQKYANAQDETSKNYINPVGRFIGEIVRNGNGVITGIFFEQQ